jgi:proteasome lid subunit RPN8/RPN11
MKTLHYETVVLAPSFQSRMADHALAHYPKECCGVVGGRKNVVSSVYPLTNSLDSSHAFQANEEELFDAVRKMRENGEEMLGIFHSHPHGPAEPSEIDRDQNFYPGHFYFVISCLDPQNPQIACFIMEEDKTFNKVELI